jgi:group II intron reverse transcriptase/maturase
LESLTTKANKQNYKYDRLHRNLYNPNFYLLAYQRIHQNPGNMTPGTDQKTLDGTSMQRFENIIENIRNHRYQPTPAKRFYILKSNGKQRPLSIPSVDDKIVQEIIRLILESIYEPTFSSHSHGFRPNKSPHTALDYIKDNFTATKWFVEGDLQKCFDSIDHHILINILRKRIADQNFLDLIWKFLRAGYLEQWTYHNTYSGTPQGSIISPILANICLNEFDNYMAQYAKNFNQGKQREDNPEYIRTYSNYYRRQTKLLKNNDSLHQEQRRQIVAEIKKLRRHLKSIPSVNPNDESYRRLQYVRFADDFLIGVIGNKQDALQVKCDIVQFFSQKLQMALSEEKTLITPGQDRVRFLGYNVAVFKGYYNKRIRNGHTARVNNGVIMLYVPYDKWVNRLLVYKALRISYDTRRNNAEVWKPVTRASLLRFDDLEILCQYNAEVRGLYNYYRLANNVSVLNNFGYVMKFSMFETFANKYRTSVGRIIARYRQGKDFAVRYRTKTGVGCAVFYNKGFCRDVLVREGYVDVVAKMTAQYCRCGLIKRLSACRCEVCGAIDVPVEVHHVRKLKDLSGKKRWEVEMLARVRKTLVLCVSCHGRLHAGVLD